ncbi:DUF309 domain-containing protein [Halalkalibacterium ligniniphilum]|uniref:DUF309 domain-containing protein n=1 Tax=Halalkalibacterium ligniniphilum TaxID=1134413 RepID=UPI000344C9AE|nr:DUF309 domain-containing protein [Halalkalibacterium ligniniphilum]
MYSKAYLDFLVYFHGFRDYFECHEVLEEHWKEAPRSERKPHWVALIQIAVALYHQRRGNLVGAKRMFTNALRLTKLESERIDELGIDSTVLIDMLQKRLDSLTTEPFEDMNLPLTAEVLELTKKRCEKQGVIFGTPSNLVDRMLISKHSMRDRTDVIEERLKQMERRASK